MKNEGILDLRWRFMLYSKMAFLVVNLQGDKQNDA